MIGETLYILDPSLTDFRGHHYMLTDAASRSAELAGMQSVWLASDKAQDTIKRPNVKVEPWFGASLYDAYRGAHDRPSLIQRVMAKTGLKKKQKPPPIDAAATLARDIERAIEAFGRDARFFVHTADGAFYRALGMIAPRLSGNAAPAIHICTPYDPVGVMPNKGSDGEIATAIAALAKAGLIDRNIFLYGENAYLADHLTSIWGVRVRPLEIPYVAPAPDQVEKMRKTFRSRLRVTDETLVVASLGPARVEKGFHLIPDIVRRCHEFISNGDYPALSGASIHFALHAAPQIIGRDPVVATAIEKLEVQDHDMATLFKEPMSEADYQALLAACDAVVMPYDADKYRVRGSGVVIEALGAGKIIFATENSYPAMRIAEGAGSAANAPIEFARAICEAASGCAVYIEKAREAGRAFAAENSLQAYVEKLLAAEREAGV